MTFEQRWARHGPIASTCAISRPLSITISYSHTHLSDPLDMDTFSPVWYRRHHHVLYVHIRLISHSLIVSCHRSSIQPSSFLTASAPTSPACTCFDYHLATRPSK